MQLFDPQLIKYVNPAIVVFDGKNYIIEYWDVNTEIGKIACPFVWKIHCFLDAVWRADN